MAHSYRPHHVIVNQKESRKQEEKKSEKKTILMVLNWQEDRLIPIHCSPFSIFFSYVHRLTPMMVQWRCELYVKKKCFVIYQVLLLNVCLWVWHRLSWLPFVVPDMAIAPTCENFQKSYTYNTILHMRCHKRTRYFRIIQGEFIYIEKS